jgi:hypothetical protein
MNKIEWKYEGSISSCNSYANEKNLALFKITIEWRKKKFFFPFFINTVEVKKLSLLLEFYTNLI